MSPKTYPVTDLATVPPIEFVLGDETFRVPRKQRWDVMLFISQNTIQLANGELDIKVSAARGAIIQLLARELWDPEARAEDQHEGEEPAGAWVPCDDVQRFIDLTNGNRVAIADHTYGAIINDLTEEITGGHPTGARSS